MEEEDDPLVRSAARLVESEGRVLRKEKLNVTRLSNANKAEESEAMIQAMSFHPAGR